MNHCAIQQRKEAVVCPKPRRLGLINCNEPTHLRAPMRWHVSYHHQESCDAKAGNELLDIILTKGGSCTTDQIPSSPPFFSGSPPSRAPNPLIQDVRFGDEKVNPISPRKVNHARASFGSNHPTVRIEGFDCRLDRDRRNRSVPTMA